jgi:hypothetical protein
MSKRRVSCSTLNVRPLPGAVEAVAVIPALKTKGVDETDHQKQIIWGKRKTHRHSMAKTSIQSFAHVDHSRRFRETETLILQDPVRYPFIQIG